VPLVQMRLGDLILDERCQMRVAFSEEHAQRLADHLEDGGTLPPLVAFRPFPERGGPAILADGWHRRRAWELRRARYVEVNVLRGGMREAIFYAAGCNAKSPLSPSAEDRKKAALSLLEDHEWCRMSARAIYRHTGCNRDTIAQLREALLSGRNGQMREGGVKVERGGSTYTMRFRDMAPAEQLAAVGAETERCRSGWGRELREALETAERLAAALGGTHCVVLRRTQETLAELRRVEKAGAA
jgi:hypothetical protein